MTMLDTVVIVADLIARGPHRFVIVTPVTRCDRYGTEVLDYGPDAHRRGARGWIQARGSSDLEASDRSSGYTAEQTLYTHSELRAHDRVEHGDHTYLIDGTVDQLATPHGSHHYRATLRSSTG